MLWSENRGKLKDWESPGIEVRTPCLCSKFWSTPNGVLTAHTESLPGAYLHEAFQSHLYSTYRILWGVWLWGVWLWGVWLWGVWLWGVWLWGVWLSGCRDSVAEHWRLKPEVSWVQFPTTASLFTCLYFCLKTSKNSFILCNTIPTAVLPQQRKL